MREREGGRGGGGGGEEENRMLESYIAKPPNIDTQGQGNTRRGILFRTGINVRYTYMYISYVYSESPVHT